jgi:hypothetical protein
VALTEEDAPPFMEARFGGYAEGWTTPPFVPSIMREHGFDPDLYVCNHAQRLGVTTVDADRAWHPTVVGDMAHLPFRDRSFRCAFFDPPYEAPYRAAVEELGRVCREALAVLHVRDVAPPRRAGVDAWGRNVWRRAGRVLVPCGDDKLIRCLALFRRRTP